MENRNERSDFSMHIDYLTEGREISYTAYNVIIGALLSYGFLLDTFLVIRFSDTMRRTNPLIFLLIYFAAMIAGSFMIRSRNAVMGFLGYNLIAIPIGLMLSILLPSYPAELISQAVLITAGISLVMTVASIMFPQFFARIGSTLFISLIVLIIVELVAGLFGYRGTIFDYLVCALFSLYIGFDWYRANNLYRTASNAISVAANLYLDIINIFLRILSILGKRK